MSGERSPALEWRGVRKVFGGGAQPVVAVERADAQLQAGEVVALLGPSGSGKSTLLLMAGLLEPPSEGEVWLAGRLANGPQGAALPDPVAYRRQHIGFVFQKPNLIGFLTALENVQLALQLNDSPAAQARARALELLGYLEVAHRARNRPAQLSGGEQQRVAIARALANRPRLILADEPTAALDGARGRQVLTLFRRVASELGSAVLLVTHDHRSLDAVDRILDMEDGRLHERAR